MGFGAFGAFEPSAALNPAWEGAGVSQRTADAASSAVRGAMLSLVTVNQSIPNALITAIEWNNDVIEPDAFVLPLGPSPPFTLLQVTRAGLYELKLNLGWTKPKDGDAYLGLIFNTTTAVPVAIMAGDTGTGAASVETWSQSVSQLAILQAGDILAAAVEIFTVDALPRELISVPPPLAFFTYFTATLLRPGNL